MVLKGVRGEAHEMVDSLLDKENERASSVGVDKGCMPIATYSVATYCD